MQLHFWSFFLKFQQQYIYTQFEADYAHWVFPLFDQPDLKAKWTLTAAIPTDWDALSNEFVDPNATERSKAALGLIKDTATLFSLDLESYGELKLYPFLESYKISTYLYAFCAGAYEYQEKNSDGLPPMRIYARKSLIKELNFDEMFNVTQAGIKFYSQFFGAPYPFNKYDQIFVPEHNFGAMENVGCVTYNENYLFRGEIPSVAKRLRFASTNLHELAHMWFGNLVTMKWWNDLWLNESFATFMSFVALDQAPEVQYFKNHWVEFLGDKFWGIRSDTLSTTHPITCTINSTDEAEEIFDGISYGKGASWLKQVYNLLGYDVISKGLGLYFTKNARKNTELTDFIGALNDAYLQYGNQSLGPDFNLTEWSDTWL